MRTLRLVQEAIDPGGTHRVAVELEGDGPRRTATARVRLELDAAELERVRWYLEDYLEYPIDPAPTIAAQVEGRLVELGRELFGQVFGDREATRLWDRVEPELADTRVEVVTDVAGATAVPWELLRDPLTNTPLALRAGAFVRSNPQPARLLDPPARSAERLRILLVICRPGGADDVPFRSVASHLVRVSDDARRAFDLDVLRPPTFARLGQVLGDARRRRAPYHVVHFDGHGIWADLSQGADGGSSGAPSPLRFGDARSGAHGYLLFEEPGAPGNIRHVNGPELGDLLAQTGVPVLVLNACRSAHAELATTPEEAAAQVKATPGDPHARVRAYGSLAQEVIDAGVPGVVAMRYTVYVVTAARFVGELYASLLAGHGLGESVTRGRQHLAADPTREVSLRPLELQDWMVPVVYEAAPMAVVSAPADVGALTITVPKAATGQDQPEAETTLPGSPEVGFYGRDETLLALDRAFDAQPVVLLHAYAGAGKTTTAAEFARWYHRTGGLADQGDDGPVLFTAFTGYRPLARVLDQVGQVFGDALQAAEVPWGALDDRQRREVAVQVLGQVPVLWVWDNVELVAGFPEGTPSAWTTAEQDELRRFLADLQATRAKVLVTSRRDERAWLGELAARVALPPMPTAERVQLARAIAAKHGRRLAEVEDWRPLLAYTQGNPLTLTVLVGQALRDGIQTLDQVEGFVGRLRAGEATLADDEREGRTRSLGASLGYGFTHGFSKAERAQLALLHLFQGFVDVETLRVMGHPAVPGGPVPALRGRTRDQGIGLLDRAAEVGLLSGYGGGYYAIHPALPWYFGELFTTAYGPAGSPAAQQATRAYTSAIADLGDHYHNRYGDGRPEVVGVLGAEEANLLHARRLARTHGWWDQVMSAMQGLRTLYEHTGRRVEWARMVEELVPALVDPATEGPRPGHDDHYSLLTNYRLQLARDRRDYDAVERLLRTRVGWDRKRAAAAMATRPRKLDIRQRNRIRTLATSVLELGDLLRERQQPACVESYLETRELTRRIGDRPAEAVAAFNLGRAYGEVQRLRDLDAAERWYQHSLDLRDPADRLGGARSVGQLGLVHYQRYLEAQKAGRPERELLGHLEAALRAYHQALDLAPTDAVGELAVANNQLGIISALMGDADGAVRHWQESLRHEETRGNRYGAALSRFNIAVTLAQRGRFGDALLWAEAALRDYQTYGNRAAADTATTQQFIAGIEQAMTGQGV